ncbi:GNAT family N-acetyltransferase [Aestuariibacter sp. AA17]|uniref:GNAT family N-acetyltransferase n=1 Tax=Fluctibacter corallii TaxID=2984329 RepID=A0ABT3A6W2_9ALTE|nr:GNAT family protein [Aestuariibacter sp. AA17]MCV2884425.1 GNAT family N-acetyltransferase [Aestuariibacter sp. AA17]
MELTAFEESDYQQLINWIDSKELNYLWGGPAYTFPLSYQQIKHHCAQEAAFPFLVKHEGKNVGFIELFQVSLSEFRVCRVFIANEFRGQGLAQEMMRLITQKAQLDFNANLLTLNVFSHNESAIRCYEKLGFQITSTQAGNREFEGKVWELSAMEKRLERIA